MKFIRKRIVRLSVSVWFVLAACVSCSPSEEHDGKFKDQPFTISHYGLFDLGVADINKDGHLDVYTSNYSAEQSLLLNNGAGGYTDVYSLWKMEQDHNFPGLAISPEKPIGQKQGVYINWVGPDVSIRSKEIGAAHAVIGRIEAYTSVKILIKKNFDVKVTEKILSPEVTHTVIEFSGHGDGQFRFTPRTHALPFNFHIEGDISAQNVYVGKNMISPGSNDFVFQLKDRHGMAWADFNDDDQMDVFISRGGIKSTMKELPMSFWEELYIRTPECMEDVGESAGLLKKGCPGRQVALIDYDNDNQLEIYIVCGRSSITHANMLFKKNGNLHFEDVAPAAMLNLPSNGSFVWLDLDHDNDQDFFWSAADGFYVLENNAGKFQPTKLAAHNRKGISHKLTVADFDNDGDLDIFSASPRGNLLFRNTNGILSAILPLSLGLPDKSYTVNWVDYDNDGNMDLHAAPQGLYVQNQKGVFALYSQLSLQKNVFSPFKPIGAIAAWFDADNNGTRDMLLAAQYNIKKNLYAKWVAQAMDSKERFGGLGYFWQVDFYRNENVENHWLQVELIGPPGNRQAIGATVTLQTGGWRQIQQTGNSDGAHYSQGHYRLYFGLGKDPSSISLHIRWPDGKTTDIKDVSSDQLLKINWQEHL